MTAQDELQEATERILSSDSPRKLIVAGPGAGKTYIFKKLLERSGTARSDHLVLTFINELKNDLEADLFGLARVGTLHGYCYGLLKTQAAIRAGLTADFECLPGFASLVKSDWRCVNEGAAAPHFVGQMRETESTDATDFYLSRGHYYDAVDFDDCVFRVYRAWTDDLSLIDSKDLVLIDEFQDFNRVEAGVIELLGLGSAIVIAGDDDQALYSTLRGASSMFIRGLHAGGEFEVFELPFCMRCPEVIVGAVNDVVQRARATGRLEGRIEKPFRYYEPQKGEDSARYPRVDLVTCSVQRGNANYFGQYIAQEIKQIPEEEVTQAAEHGDPPVLVIGSKPYRGQVVQYLRDRGFTVDTKRGSVQTLSRQDGLSRLRRNPESDLGWRIVLEYDRPAFFAQAIRRSVNGGQPLVDILPEDYRATLLAEAEALDETPADVDEDVANIVGPVPYAIKVVSFEGAKGLEAQHVFILGPHENELPRDAANIEDLEICRFLVGLTRAKKKCSLLTTRRFGNEVRRPSLFLSWIDNARYDRKTIDANYWRHKAARER